MRTRGVDFIRQYSHKNLEKEVSATSSDLNYAQLAAYQVLQSWLKPTNELSQPNAEVLSALDCVPYFDKQLVKEYSCQIYIHFQSYASPMLVMPTNANEVMIMLRTMQNIKAHYLYPLQFMNLSSVMASEVVSIVVECLKEAVCSDQQTFAELLYSFFTEYPIISQNSISGEAYQILVDCHLENVASRVVCSALIREIRTHIYDSYSGEWESSVWPDFNEWLQASMMPSLEKLLDKQVDAEGLLYKLGEQFLVELRVSEIFDIVLGYPGSIEALNDLKGCLKLPSQRAAVVSEFQKSCSIRLLHGGTNTVDIIAAYIATVRAFTVIDPKGVLLNKVFRPIRRYLRDREDAVSVIVSGLLGNGGPEISELADLISQEASDNTSENPEKDDLLDLNWNPDPVDAPPDFIRDNVQDIIDSLLSIYDNKEVFVRELMNVFAYRMLSQPGESSQAMFNLDLLKSRFEERELQSLEVMVRDVIHSEHLNNTIGASPAVDVQPKILSGLFWPSLRSDSYLYPQHIEDSLNSYSASFSEQKPGRKLDWVKNAGYVVLELELANRTEQVHVTPDQATVIMHFQDGPKTVEQVQQITQMSDLNIKSCLSFWISRGILEAKGPEYHVIETNDGTAARGMEDSMASSALQAAEERAKEEMKVYWQYIVGMLTNLGAKPSEQIHSFLKMLVPKETPYTKSESELSRYLSQMVDEGKLELMAGGLFKLKK